MCIHHSCQNLRTLDSNASGALYLQEVQTATPLAHFTHKKCRCLLRRVIDLEVVWVKEPNTSLDVIASSSIHHYTVTLRLDN